MMQPNRGIPPSDAYWFDYDINNPHSIDDGVDVPDPNDTVYTFPFTGKVFDTSYHDYGGQVVAKIPGQSYDEYSIHLDRIFVKPGDYVRGWDSDPTGRTVTVIGTTGGGLGDLLLHPDPGGRVQPALDMSWYDGHSSGYHNETGIFLDPSQNGDMQEFNRGWRNKQRQLDPTPAIQNLRAGTPQKFWELYGGNAGGNSGGIDWPSIPIVGALIGAFGSLLDNWGESIASGIFVGLTATFGVITQALHDMTGGFKEFSLRLVLAGIGIFAIIHGAREIVAALNGDETITSPIQQVRDRAEAVKEKTLAVAKDIPVVGAAAAAA